MGEGSIAKLNKKREREKGQKEKRFSRVFWRQIAMLTTAPVKSTKKSHKLIFHKPAHSIVGT